MLSIHSGFGAYDCFQSPLSPRWVKVRGIPDGRYVFEKKTQTKIVQFDYTNNLCTSFLPDVNVDLHDLLNKYISITFLP